MKRIAPEECITAGLSSKLREHDAVVDLREQYQALRDVKLRLNACIDYSTEAEKEVKA